MQHIIAVTCSFCGKWDESNREELANRGWRFLDVVEREVTQPCFEEAAFETLADFIVCSECSQQARQAVQHVQKYMKDNPPPKGGS